MELSQFEQEVITQLSLNLEDSQDEVPVMTGRTGIFTGIAGFDSLRAIEVLVALEAVFNRELPPEKIFVKKPTSETTVRDVAEAIKVIVDGTES